MERSDPRSPDQPGQPTPITCVQAEGLIERLAFGGLPGPIATLLRQHLSGCASCKSEYRGRMETQARLGRQVRESHRGAISVEHGGLGPERQEPRIRPKSLRRFAMFVVPAALFFFATRLSSDWNFEPPLTAHWVEGTSWIGGHALDADSVSVKLVRSDLILTEPGARCRIEAGSFDLSIDPGARLLVISSLTRRVRLEEGQVELEGRATLETPLGMVEVFDGEAQITLDGGGLEVLARSGDVVLVDARGRRALPVVEADAVVGL
ncbi:FecR domain-containing protein [Engelhardtia mirabilis]|uniref:Zinc-finger domain-containing protein n=1 Tax=Engelhardtia mirabilis TaxID=2528011 RepID=A0A518BL86_9BACT|nr:hypothetical protein Pla133_28310 [Planctomycetes bacterium Pla133]QDV02068.1 hypothetical protein Pla86_28300 [Planctomycetes bacterium Pla86]